MNSAPTLIIKENWLTRKPNPSAYDATYIVGFLLFAITALYFSNYFHAQDWLSANGDQVFNQHQYWRAWTTLLIHGDWGHFLSNAFLFIPLTFFFTAYYGVVFFPIIGFLVGGLINILVLKTMAPHVTLLGVSGVVYWMGAAWLTLYMLIDRRESLKRRFARSIILAVLLFAPEAYKPEISYLSHLFGFIGGIVSAIIYYMIKREMFKSAEVIEYIDETFIETPSELTLLTHN